MNSGNSCSFGQSFVDQGPRYDNQLKRRKKRGRRENQVLSKSGIIRPDLRVKARYL